MSKGYVIFAQGNYLPIAELLAKSIRATQSTVKDVHIITATDGNVMLNRTQIYNLSPFDETVMLDADMIFLEDVSHWWEHLAKFPLVITNKVRTYQNEPVVYSPYRKTFVANNLSNCYCAFTYFKKDPQAEVFFKLLSHIINNWREWVDRYAPEYKQVWPSIDVAMGIAIKILGIDPFSPLDYPTFTHMKSGCQGWPEYSERWRDHLGCYISNGQLKLGSYTQTGILHYVDKELYNDLLRLF
jgi:hypothetical protein